MRILILDDTPIVRRDLGDAMSAGGIDRHSSTLRSNEAPEDRAVADICSDGPNVDEQRGRSQPRRASPRMVSAPQGAR